MVLDPFAGVGTTGRVAGRLQRRFMLVEKSLKYFDIQCTDEELLQYSPEQLDYEYFASTI